jgi:hypothetical protein
MRTRNILLLVLLAGFLEMAVGFASYFQLSPEAAILRESAMAGVQGNWHKKIALNVGFFTTGLVRAGSHFFKLDPEPQAAFDSIRGGEVGVYNLVGTAGWGDHGKILARADKAMSARRWDRLVGVSQEGQLVAVYVPRKAVSGSRVKCCVLVLKDTNLIVAGASANLEPLLKIAGDRFDLKEATQHLALR